MMDTVQPIFQPHISSGPYPSAYTNEPASQNRPFDNSQTDIQQADRVTLSPEAKEILTRQDQNSTSNEEDPPSVSQNLGNAAELSTEEEQQLLELRKRDAEVHAHEQAHLAAAGQHAAGGPSYTYEVGPNGKRYAVGGEVPIDISKESTPEETIQKMQVVAKAALAPANPSAADRNIAARAAMISAQARQELQAETGPQEKPSHSTSISKSKEERPELDSGSGKPVDTRTLSSETLPSSPSRHFIIQAYQNQI